MTVVPATVVLAVLESSPREASIGKRTRHLRVVDAVTGSRVSLRRSIPRNTLKIGVPWTIGHAAVFSIVQAGGSVSVPVSVWLLTVVAYVLPIMYVAFLFVGQGRTPYDLISGTVVIQEVQAATAS
jgi:RDD family.